MKVEIQHIRSGKTLCVLEDVKPSTTILQIKKLFEAKSPKYYPDRQQFKVSKERGAKGLKDEDTLNSVGLKGSEGVLYFKDLGTQIGWTTVFFSEYTGPLLVYLIFYFRPSFIYGSYVPMKPMDPIVHIACACWTFHYAKRLLETIFIHRFSHNTMPIKNLFINCSYYWSFAGFVSYFVNHPLYTIPYYGYSQVFGGLLLFAICEIGNFSIHYALRNLRPPGIYSFINVN
jgi:very-long-chain enoyl-CoA reductase